MFTCFNTLFTRTTKTFLLLGLLLITSSAFAQTDFKPGYVITNPGDTIRGEIDYRGDLLMGKLCRFKDSNGKEHEFLPVDIQGYRFTDSKYYISNEVNGKEVFLEYLINGKVSIYYLRDDNGDHFFIDKEGEVMNEIPYKEENFMGTQNRVEYHSQTRKHVGLLTYYMQDAPELRTRINNMSKPGYRSLVNLAEDYHSAVCKDDQCIIYERDLPWVKIAVEPFVGVVNYRKRIMNTPVSEYGAKIYIWAPRTNENLYFKTGAGYNFKTINNTNYYFIKFPIHMEYKYSAYNLQPKLSAGADVYTGGLIYEPAFYTYDLGFGLNYKLSKMASVSTNFNTEYTPIEFVLMSDEGKFGLFSYSVNIGVYVSF